MEFLYPNYINTTTQISVDSNTGVTYYLMVRNTEFQYASEQFNDDLTTTTITINFDSTQTVSRIALIEHNIKDYTVFYNGATANTFALSTTSDTTTTNYSANSGTSQYFKVTPVACTSVTFDLSKTMLPDNEKAIGYMYIGNQLLDFDRIPSASDYTPRINPKQVVHQLSDGSQRLQTLDKKFSASIKLKHITQSFRDSLYSVYNTQSDFMFVEFGTTTGWNEIMYSVIWPGKFEFFKYSDNFVAAGYSGSIVLSESSL